MCFVYPERVLHHATDIPMSTCSLDIRDLRGFHPSCYNTAFSFAAVESQEAKKMPQSLAQIYLHIVFSTKDRRPFLQDDERYLWD